MYFVIFIFVSLSFSMSQRPPRHGGGGGHYGCRYCYCHCPACDQRPQLLENRRWEDDHCHRCCPPCKPCNQKTTEAPMSSTTSQPSNQDTCPCIRPTSGGPCVVTESESHSNNVDDAVLNFIDLTAFTQEGAKPLVTDDSDKSKIFKTTSSATCHSKQCKGCVGVILDKIEKSLEETNESTRNETLSFIKKTRTRLNIPSDGTMNEHCTRLQPTSSPPTVTPNSTETPYSITITFEEWIKGKCTLNLAPAKHRKWQKKLDREHASRQKRQWNSGTGVSTPISCNYQKGNDLGDGSGFVGLCNTCWSWRTLPANYVPRMLNEVSCDSSNNRCLSGWGTCRSKQKPISVLYNYGTGGQTNYQEMSMTVSVGCECNVPTNSPLISFIKG